MKTYIEERAVEIANYIVENGATVRQTAKKFGVSKSTVHKDVTERMEEINPRLAEDFRHQQVRTAYPGWNGDKRKVSSFT